MDERRRATRGLAVRRAVLGNEHVARTLRGRTGFNRDFQDLLTRYAWGEIWTRPGLPRRTRSLVTLAALVALGREHELRLHLRAALRNGVTRGEIGEVLLQMAVYCGLPAANDAFRLAADVFAERDAGGRDRRPRRARR
jgi:4-carboxymuconolactone decarboxylase